MSTELEQKLITALQKIVKVEGEYSLDQYDQYEHACNYIVNMKQIANDALLDVAADVAAKEVTWLRP